MAAPVGQNRLIIAIDYGTTFTGVAYQLVEHNQTVAKPLEVKVLTNWDAGVGLKVPSEISYSASQEHNYNWGFSIDKKAVKMSWTKLQLDQQSRAQELTWILEALKGMKEGMANLNSEHGMPSYPAKNPIDIVADYLRKVREKVIVELRSIYGAVFNDLPKEIVVTVPAQWSDEAKNLTFRALVKAGFTKRFFRNLQGTLLITEPEAAALYCAKVLMPDDEYDAEDFLSPGDCFVQADMGGGTVDCISYIVLNTKPSMKLQEVGYATGAKCGATFIDLEFIRWLSRKLGDEYFRMLSDDRPVESFSVHNVFGAGIRSVLEQFDKMKMTYDGNAQPNMSRITLPGDLYDVDDPDRGIDEGVIVLTNADFMKIFHFSLDQTTKLIAAQTGQITYAGYPTKRIFLSGGFSENPYVKRAIVEFGRQRGIDVNYPAQPTVAVVRGAVVRRIEENATAGVYMIECPKSYGITMSQPYSAYLHDRADAYRDPFDSQYKARDQMVWLIKKGDVLLSNQPKTAVSKFCRRFSTNDPKIFSTSLVAYDGTVDGNDPQQRKQRYANIPSALRKVIPLRYDLADIPPERFAYPRGGHGPPYCCAYLEARLKISSDAQGSLSIHFGRRELSIADINDNRRVVREGLI